MNLGQMVGQQWISTTSMRNFQWERSSWNLPQHVERNQGIEQSRHEDAQVRLANDDDEPNGMSDCRPKAARKKKHRLWALLILHNKLCMHKLIVNEINQSTVSQYKERKSTKIITGLDSQNGDNRNLILIMNNWTSHKYQVLWWCFNAQEIILLLWIPIKHKSSDFQTVWFLDVL